MNIETVETRRLLTIQRDSRGIWRQFIDLELQRREQELKTIQSLEEKRIDRLYLMQDGHIEQHDNNQY